MLIGPSGTPGTSLPISGIEGAVFLTSHIFRAEPIGNAFLPQFLKLAINSRLLELIEQARGGVGLQHITKPKLEKLPLTLPPFAEQHRIVAKVDDLLALYDRWEAQLTTAQDETRRLLEATLHKALAASSG